MKITRMIYLAAICGLILIQGCGSKKKKQDHRTSLAEDGMVDENEEAADGDAIPEGTVATVATLQAYMGVRSFAEINATFSTLTGVPTTQTNVNTIYDQVRFSLPSETNDIRAFSGPHQAAILKLASQYCQVFLDVQASRDEILKMPGTGNPIGPLLGQIADNPTLKRALGRVFAERFWVTTAGIVDFKVAEDEAEKLIDLLLVAEGPTGQRFGGDVMPFAVCSAVLSSLPTIER